jgi:hypothetical protein
MPQVQDVTAVAPEEAWTIVVREVFFRQMTKFVIFGNALTKAVAAKLSTVDALHQLGPGVGHPSLHFLWSDGFSRHVLKAEDNGICKIWMQRGQQKGHGHKRWVVEESCSLFFKCFGPGTRIPCIQMLAIEYIVVVKEGCLLFVVNDTMVEAKKREVVDPIGRLVGFACVSSPFQISLELHLFLDEKYDVHRMSDRMLKEPPLVASLLRVVGTLGWLVPSPFEQ